MSIYIKNTNSLAFTRRFSDEATAIWHILSYCGETGDSYEKFEIRPTYKLKPI